MKLFLTVLSSLCLLAANAQTDTAVIQRPDERVIMQSKVRQLVSYLNEGNESAASVLFREVSGMMEQFISRTQAAIDTASGAEKRSLEDKLNRQRQLVAQFQSFKPALIRNRQSIDAWTQEFLKTLY